MNETNQNERIDRLEMLLSEHEYTVETLNAIVTEQSDQLSLLNTQVETLKNQVKELKSYLPQQQAVDEKPPHY